MTISSQAPIGVDKVTPYYLADIVENSTHHANTRAAAASRLLELWKKGGEAVTLDLLEKVAAYAPEPYKSEAAKIVRENSFVSQLATIGLRIRTA